MCRAFKPEYEKAAAFLIKHSKVHVFRLDCAVDVSTHTLVLLNTPGMALLACPYSWRSRDMLAFIPMQAQTLPGAPTQPASARQCYKPQLSFCHGPQAAGCLPIRTSTKQWWQPCSSFPLFLQSVILCCHAVEPGSLSYIALRHICLFPACCTCHVDDAARRV